MDFNDFQQSDEELDGQGGDEFFLVDELGEMADPEIIPTNDAVIFLVDCQDYIMNGYFSEQNTHFERIMSAYLSFIKQKIIGSSLDKVGLILMNVKTKKNGPGFKGINIVHGLDSIDAKRIKEVPELVGDFDSRFGGLEQGDSRYYEALWLCNHQFKVLDKQKYYMRIFLFTNQDNPNSTEQDLRNQLISHLEQLRQMDVMIELFPIACSVKQEFNFDRFWVDVLQIDQDEINGTTMYTTNKMLDLEVRMKQKAFKKRTLNRLFFQIGENIRCGVKVYCTLNKAKKPSAKQLESATNKELKKVTKLLCEETAQTLHPAQIGTYFPMGQRETQKVPISKEEMSKIKELETPGIKLIGFKNSEKLKIYQNIRHSYFVYPDEEHVKGSSQFFDSLLKSMTLKNKIAIAKIVPRKGSQLKYCALVPQIEKYDENHFQTPPGLNLIFLPFADDFRNLKTVRGNQKFEPQEENINLAEIIIKKLNSKNFNCRDFDDPSIQKFYDHLQAHALQEPVPNQTEDLLEPNQEVFQSERVTQLMEMFSTNLQINNNNDNQNKKTTAPKKKTNIDIQITKNQPKVKDQTGAAKKKATKKNSKFEKDLDEIDEDSRQLEINDYEEDSFVVKDEEFSDDDFNTKRKKKNNQTTKGNARNQSQSRSKSKEKNDGNEIDKIENYLKQGELDKLTNNDLKSYLKNAGLKVGGKKDELITRCLDYLFEKKK